MLVEARARGAVPLVRATTIDTTRLAADEPIILVVADAEAAEQLRIPTL